MKKLLGIFILTYCLPAAANLEIGGDISLSSNDNLPNAVSDQDIFDDRFVALNLDVGKLWVPRPGQSWLLTGHLQARHFEHSNGLNLRGAGVSLSYIHRFGLGAFAPRARLMLRADNRQFDSNYRSGWLYTATAGLQKRFTPSLHGAISAGLEQRTANSSDATPYTPQTSGDVFNQDSLLFSSSLDYVFANNAQVTVAYNFRDGEIDASTNPGSAFFPFANAIAKDAGLCSQCANYVVYQVDAASHAIQLDWNWPLGRDSSVSLNMQRRVADTKGGNTYTNTFFTLKLARRFK